MRIHDSDPFNIFHNELEDALSASFFKDLMPCRVPRRKIHLAGCPDALESRLCLFRCGTLEFRSEVVTGLHGDYQGDPPSFFHRRRRPAGSTMVNLREFLGKIELMGEYNLI